MTPVQPPDDALAARLLAGRPRPADLDGDYGAVARLLVIACDGLLEEAEAPDPALVAGLRAAAAESVVDLRDRKRGRHIARTLVIAGVIGFGASAAAAANGSLPSSVQDVVHDIAGIAGVDLPAGSQDGPGHGRSDEAPGRPEDPGRPVDPGRSDEAPGQPEDPGNGGGSGVGSDGIPPGQGGTIPGDANANGSDNGGGVGSDGVPPGQGGTIPANGTPGGGNARGSGNPDAGTNANANVNANGNADATSASNGGGNANGAGNGSANASGHAEPGDG